MVERQNGEWVKVRGTMVKGTELKLGAIVDLGMAYGIATVKQIEGTPDKPNSQYVTFFRPYVHYDEVEYSGPSIICYVGVEVFKAWAGQEYDMVEQGRPLK